MPEGKQRDAEGYASEWIDPRSSPFDSDLGTFKFLKHLDRTRIIDPRRVIPRMRNQSGQFTIHQCAPDDGRFDLVPLNFNNREKPKLTRLVIEGRSKKKMMSPIRK